MLKNTSLKNKLIIVLSILISINVIVGGYILFNTVLLNKKVALVDTIQISLDHMFELEEQVNLAHSNITDFVNLGNLDHKNSSEENWDGVPEKEKQAYESLQKVDKQSMEQLKIAIDSAEKWHDEIAKKQIKLMQSPQTVDMARLLEASEANINLWNNIHSNLATITKKLTQRVREAEISQKNLMNLTTYAVAIGVLLTVIGAIVAAFFLIQVVARPLNELVVVTTKLVQKEWDVKIDKTDQKDEIGQMANALLLFKDNGIENERLQEAQQQEDAARLARAKRIEELVGQFQNDSEDTTGALDQATHDMKTTSDMMNQIAHQTSQLSAEATAAANNTGINVQGVSAATEELTASIHGIHQQLNKTNEQASTARKTAETSVEKMAILEESVNDIVSVIDIITDIAEQTNLLALNATIESARAGEAGKGFAVVASEVKNLANETAKATEDVRQKIELMQSHTRDSVESIKTISSLIDDLSVAANSIAETMEEQTSATQEISKNAGEAASGTNQVVSNINQVNLATDETGTTAKKVNDVAEQLSTRSDQLKSSIRTFIEQIKAA